MISLAEIGIGAVVAVVVIAAGIRNGARQVPKYAKPELTSQPEPTLRSVLFQQTKWMLVGHILLPAMLIILAAFGLFDGNQAAALIGLTASAYAAYRIASWSTVMFCLGDRPASAPDSPPTARES